MARPRMRYSLRTLIAEVTDVFPNVEIKVLGENELGVAHTVIFDNTASAWLAPFLEIIAKDPRIEFAEMREDGRAWIKVKDSNRLADDASEFGLAGAADTAGFENPSLYALQGEQVCVTQTGHLVEGDAGEAAEVDGAGSDAGVGVDEDGPVSGVDGGPDVGISGVPSEDPLDGN